MRLSMGSSKRLHQRDRSFSGEATGKSPAFFQSAGIVTGPDEEPDLSAQEPSPTGIRRRRGRLRVGFMRDWRALPAPRHAVLDGLELKHRMAGVVGNPDQFRCDGGLPDWPCRFRRNVGRRDGSRPRLWRHAARKQAACRPLASPLWPTTWKLLVQHSRPRGTESTGFGGGEGRVEIAGEDGGRMEFGQFPPIEPRIGRSVKFHAVPTVPPVCRRFRSEAPRNGASQTRETKSAGRSREFDRRLKPRPASGITHREIDTRHQRVARNRL